MMARRYQRKPGLTVFLGSTIAGTLMSALVAAAEVSHGEMAGAIRSAGYPCAHVVKLDRAGDNAWVVQCNSGTFNASRDQEGRFKVTRAEGDAAK